MSHAVFCIAKSEGVARDIVEKLKVMGFSADDISVLFADRKGTKDFAYEQNTKAPEGATTGGVLGAGAGACWAGWRESAHWRFPALAPSWPRDHYGRARRRGDRRATGGLIGALVGMGIPEFEAKRYEGKLKEGNILISVHTEDSKERARAKDVFELAGADDISYTTETAVSREAARDEDRRRQAKRRDEARRADAQADRLFTPTTATTTRISARTGSRIMRVQAAHMMNTRPPIVMDRSCTPRPLPRLYMGRDRT